MYTNKLEISSRDNLIILGDRSGEVLPSDEFLVGKMKEAGCAKVLHILMQMRLENDLYKIIQEKFFDPSSDKVGLCVFPGRSAHKIRERNEGQNNHSESVFGRSTSVSVHASRRFDAFGNAIVTVGEVMRGRIVCPEVRIIIVVDDVISSGATCRKLCDRNRYKFPRAEWYACGCVSRQEKIPGYKEVITPLLVPLDTLGLKVPINSLSTLIDGEDVVGGEYARKHCLTPDIFVKALASVRSRDEFSQKSQRQSQANVTSLLNSLSKATINLSPF